MECFNGKPMHVQCLLHCRLSLKMSTLTEEQRRRMEENRRKALEKRAAAAARALTSANSNPSINQQRNDVSSFQKVKAPSVTDNVTSSKIFRPNGNTGFSSGGSSTNNKVSDTVNSKNLRIEVRVLLKFYLTNKKCRIGYGRYMVNF